MLFDVDQMWSMFIKVIQFWNGCVKHSNCRLVHLPQTLFWLELCFVSWYVCLRQHQQQSQNVGSLFWRGLWFSSDWFPIKSFQNETSFGFEKKMKNKTFHRWCLPSRVYILYFFCADKFCRKVVWEYPAPPFKFFLNFFLRFLINRLWMWSSYIKFKRALKWIVL